MRYNNILNKIINEVNFIEIISVDMYIDNSDHNTILFIVNFIHFIHSKTKEITMRSFAYILIC